MTWILINLTKSFNLTTELVCFRLQFVKISSALHICNVVKHCICLKARSSTYLRMNHAVLCSLWKILYGARRFRVFFPTLRRYRNIKCRQSKSLLHREMYSYRFDIKCNSDARFYEEPLIQSRFIFRKETLRERFVSWRTFLISREDTYYTHNNIHRGFTPRCRETCTCFASMHPATFVSVSLSLSFPHEAPASLYCARRAKKGVPQQNSSRIHRRCPNSARYICIYAYTYILCHSISIYFVMQLGHCRSLAPIILQHYNI